MLTLPLPRPLYLFEWACLGLPGPGNAGLLAGCRAGGRVGGMVR